MLDVRTEMIVRRELRQILGITEDDTSGRSSILANVLTKARTQGIDETIAWLHVVVQGEQLDSATAERIAVLLERHSRWR